MIDVFFSNTDVIPNRRFFYSFLQILSLSFSLSYSLSNECRQKNCTYLSFKVPAIICFFFCLNTRTRTYFTLYFCFSHLNVPNEQFEGISQYRGSFSSFSFFPLKIIIGFPLINSPRTSGDKYSCISSFEKLFYLRNVAIVEQPK